MNKIKSILSVIYNKLWSIEKSVVKDFKELGDYLQFVTPILFIAWSACFSTNYISRVFIITYFVALIISSLLKALFNNPRPKDVEVSINPDLNVDWSLSIGNSFPSGHTMSAMMGGIFWFEISFWFGIIGVILGLVCALSRIIAKAHWLRDVLASTVIAIILYLIVKIVFL